MSILARIRLTIIVLAVGIAAYIAWPSVGEAIGHAQYTAVTASDLADEVCRDPNLIDWLGLRLVIEHAAGRCVGLFVPDNQSLSAVYLQAHRAALQRVADDENARRRAAIPSAVAADLGKPMRGLLLVITIAVAAFVLAPLVLRESWLFKADSPMISPPVFLVAATVGALSLLLIPHGMFANKTTTADEVAAWGQWWGDVIVAIAAIFAVYQLWLGRKSSETDAFLKICEMVDDPIFVKKLDYVKSNSGRLRRSEVAEHGMTVFDGGTDRAELRDAVDGVLFQLEKIGTLVHFATVNKQMVVDYIGDVVTDATLALSNEIAFCQRDDPSMYERFVELNQICLQHGWKPRVTE